MNVHNCNICRTYPCICQTAAPMHPEIFQPIQQPQQGWQCPVCKYVYAPYMPVCTKCSNELTLAQRGES